jgi:FkbM family methyltransferase
MTLDMRTRVATALGLARSLLIYHGQPWKARRLKRFYRDIIEPGDLCFDIGAHVGSRSKAMLDLGARVVALEPQPAFLGFLRRAMRQPRLTIVGKGVGAAPGSFFLNVSSRHPTVTTLSTDWIASVEDTDGFRKVDWDRQVRIEVTTLDALIEEHGLPAFCKIDVEGMEAEILAGLSQPVPLVAFEYLPAARGVALACIDRLAALGPYQFNRVEGERHSFSADGWVDAPAMRRQLQELAETAGSGDVYARLQA